MSERPFRVLSACGLLDANGRSEADSRYWCVLSLARRIHVRVRAFIFACVWHACRTASLELCSHMCSRISMLSNARVELGDRLISVNGEEVEALDWTLVSKMLEITEDEGVTRLGFYRDQVASPLV